MMITASHNPYPWNGIKYKASYGSSALPSIVAQIESDLEIVQRGTWRRCHLRKTSFSS